MMTNYSQVMTLMQMTCSQMSFPETLKKCGGPGVASSLTFCTSEAVSHSLKTPEDAYGTEVKIRFLSIQHINHDIVLCDKTAKFTVTCFDYVV